MAGKYLPLLGFLSCSQYGAILKTLYFIKDYGGLSILMIRTLPVMGNSVSLSAMVLVRLTALCVAAT